MSWNYRVLHRSFTYPDGGVEHEVFIAEVHYDKLTGAPGGWRENTVASAAHLEELHGVLDLMRGALDKPVLYVHEGNQLREQPPADEATRKLLIEEAEHAELHRDDDIEYTRNRRKP